MEQDTSVSSRGSINLGAKPKKSILKRSEPEAGEAAGGDRKGSAAEAGKRHVPFSRVIPELSRLEEEDARLGRVGTDRGTSDLQSVSSAASLSPLSSDEQLDRPQVARAPGSPGPRYSGYVPPLSRDGGRDPVQRRRRPNNNRRRGNRSRPRLPQPLQDVEPLSPLRASYSPLPLELGSLSPRLLSMEDRSPSPLRLVRYSPSPERGMRGRHSRSPIRRSRSPMRRSRSPMRRSRSPMRRSRSPMYRSPGRRSRRSLSRSPPRRSRSPGRHRRGPSPPRYGRSPGRRGWSRSPSPRRRRSRSRSRSPPWGRNVERSLLAMSRSQGAAPAGYGPPQPLPPPPPQQAGMPGYPPAAYAAPGLPHPAFIPQPMPYANPPRPPLQNMAPGANAPFGQPMYASPGAAAYPQPQPSPGVSVPSVGSAGISERIDSDTFLREVEWRKQQRSSQQQQQRQLTDVQQQQQQQQRRETVSPSADTPAVQRLERDTSESADLREIQKKRPWMTQQLVDLRAEIEKCRKEKNKKNLKSLTRQWHRLVFEAKQQKGLLQSTDAVKQIREGGQLVTLSTDTVERLADQQRQYVSRRDRLAGELHQLKLEQKVLDTGNLVMKKGKPSSNRQLHDNLKRQGELLKALESVSSVVAQLKQLLDPSTDGYIDPVGAALLKAAREDTSEGGDSSSKSEVSYLLLGDETLSAVQVYVREQESRASFGTDLPAERIRLVSRPDAALGSVEFRYWVRAAVRQSAAGTLVLLASAGCLQPSSGSGAWSAAAAVAPLLPLLRDLRADGLTRAVLVGVPTKPGAGASDRAVQFNKALQEQLEAAGPHVPRVIYTPIKAGPQDGFGGQTEGGLTLDLYRTLLQVISKGEQKPAIPGALQPGDGEERRQLDSVQDASDTLQELLAGLAGRLAGDEAAGLGAVAALLDKLKSQGEGTDQLQLKKEVEEQDLNAEDPGVFFRDPADHVCLHCKQIFLNAKTYLEHLKSPEHMKQYQISQHSAPEAPWRRTIPLIEKKSKNAQSKPIKGLDMFIRVDCWYCKACELFVGDLRCASSHLKSRRHNIKYDEYLESNPGYHAVVGETRSRLLLECAEREEERTRQRRREEAQRRGDQMNERMRRQSETGVQDVTDETAAAAAPATTPPAATGKKTGIKLNLLASASQPPEELGQLKKKVQANIAAEQEAKRLKEEEVAEKEAAERQKEREAKREAEKKEEEKKKSAEKLAPTVSNQPGAAAPAKVKITLAADKTTSQQPAASGAAAKKKAMPIVGKLPRLRQKKPEKPAAEKPAAGPPAAGRPLSKSEKATLALANRKEVLASIPRPTDPSPAAGPPPEPLTEAISDEEEEAAGGLGDPADLLDLMDIDLPDADVGRRADAAELKMLGICDEDVAAQQLPATRPPL